MKREFLDMMDTLGLTDVAASLAGDTPDVSIRINPLKPPHLPFPTADTVPWCQNGLYLTQRPTFPLDPAWHQGRYYVQEAASMFVSHVMHRIIGTDDTPLAVLDACAAPGGKTTAIIDTLPHGSLIVANEYVPARAAILKENIIKWGYPAAIVTRGDTARLASVGPQFDVILADVPCSGEGMMRKDDEAVSQWSQTLIHQCAERQRLIVNDLWQALRPGGYMIYSTCTFNTLENESTLLHIIDNLGGENIPIPTQPHWHISPAISLAGTTSTAPLHACRFLPGRTRGEGLFMALIRKPSTHTSTPRATTSKPSSRTKAPKLPQSITSWLTAPHDYNFYIDGDRAMAFPTHWQPLLRHLRTATNVIHEGIHLATIKGKDYLPTQSLLMSQAFEHTAFPQVDIDTETALAYLRGHPPVLPPSTPKGIVTLSYDGHPVGAVKNLGNRTNTLYPKAWQLRI